MKDIFCAKCQQITQHTGEVDQNGEYVFRCQNVIDDVKCDRFVKFPADIDKPTFEEKVVEHEVSNVGQVDIAVQEKKLLELLGEESAPEVEPEQTEAPQE